MSVIGYYFGAGASCNALPIVDRVPELLKELVHILEHNEQLILPNLPFSDKVEELSKEEWRLEMIEDLKWLHHHSARHASVDTFAKKLYLRKEYDDLERLKLSLSIMFTIEQMRSNIDKRYDTFYASILNDSRMLLPNSIRVVSWNYDYQFEKAFYGFYDDERAEVYRDRLNIVSKFSMPYFEPNKFGIVKLNGEAILRDWSKPSKRELNFTNSYEEEFNSKTLEKIVSLYRLGKSDNNKIQSGLSFSWEEDDINPEKHIIEHAKNSLLKVTVLVVIGYSFPFFNRLIDGELLNSMNMLNKIYVQSPDAEEVIEKILAIMPAFDQNKIIPINDVNQFYLPTELNF